MESFGPVPSLRYHLELMIGEQHVSQPDANHRMIIRDQHSDWTCTRHTLAHAIRPGLLVLPTAAPTPFVPL